MSESDRLNAVLAQELPGVVRCLSPLGRRAAFPKGIVYQAAQAKGSRINATIGQLTDGSGRAMPLKPVARGGRDLPPEETFLYAPVEGPRSLREAWLARERRLAGGTSDGQASLPVVTHGLTHSLSLIAGLFSDDNTEIVLPTPSWGNYKLVFGLHASPRLVQYPFFANGRFNVQGLHDALQQVADTAIVVLNFPGNPSGYTPTSAEVADIVAAVDAAPTPVVVVVDDAYQGWLYDDACHPRSIYWDLAEALDPERSVVFKVDGATKELVFFGSRVGFVAHPGSEAGAEALLSKFKFLIRGTVGSASGPAMAMVEQALDDPIGLDAAFEERRALMARRHHALKGALAAARDDRLVPYPFNSAYFALVQLSGGLDAERLRMKLLEERSVGTIAFGDDNALRVAYCSIAESDLAELIGQIDQVARSL